MSTRMREPEESMSAETAARAPGHLSVYASPWAEYRIVGTSHRGRTPITRLEVPAGRLVLELRPRGEGAWERRVVTILDGRDASIRHVFNDD